MKQTFKLLRTTRKLKKFGEPQRKPAALMDDLRTSDIWALGMVLFVATNPDAAYPYMEEISRAMSLNPAATSRDVLEDLVRQKKCPKESNKYQILQATEWYHLTQLHTCTDFDIMQ